MSVDMADFLLARIAEDEEAARAAHVTTALPPIWDTGLFYGPSGPASEHIARHHPARVLAECEAKRRIMDAHNIEHECIEVFTDLGGAAIIASGSLIENGVLREGCQTLRLLALPYADHPDYDESWRSGT